MIILHQGHPRSISQTTADPGIYQRGPLGRCLRPAGDCAAGRADAPHEILGGYGIPYREDHREATGSPEKHGAGLM